MEPQPIHDYYVPTINFDTLSYVAGLGRPGHARYNPQQLTYEGPSQALKRITTAVGALGTVLPINPPSSNSSWDTEFRGPAIRCDPLPASEIGIVEQNVRQYIESGACYTASGYITWFGDLPYNTSSSSSDNGSTSSDADSVVQPNGIRLSNGNASFRLAVLPRLLDIIQMSSRQLPLACTGGYDFIGPAGGNDSMLLQCQLVNSTYNVAFDYVNGNQTVAIDVPRTTSEEPVAAISNITGPTNTSCVGFHAGYYLNSSAVATEFPDWKERCDFDPGLARKLAYKSMLDAFFNIISGPVALDQSSAGNILATTLLRTRELNFLTNYARAMDVSSGLEWKNAHSALFRAGREDLAGLIVPEPEDQRPTLARELEAMFQNVTVSLMSSTAFQ